MANNRELLKEALADAKSLREMAITNAKAALEESFTPQIKTMLSAKLEEMEKEDMNEEMSKKYMEDDKMEEVEKDEMKEEKEENMEEDLNLDEILAELEEADDSDEKEPVKEVDEVETEETEEEGEMEDGESDEPMDLEDMSEDDLKGFIADVIKDLVSDGTIEAGEEFVEDDEMEVMDMEDVDVDVEIDERKEYMTKKEKKQGDERFRDNKAEVETEKMRKMEEDLKAAIDSVNELKAELNEVNLLNAKLLYTNKIFKSKNLSEDKKVKVLKAFDKTTSVKEAKIVFDTLNEGITNKSKPSKRSIQGSASKATGVISEAKQPIIESNAVYDRMRQLAGLI